MHEIGLRELSLLLLSISMVVVGGFGLAGELSTGPMLVIILLTVAILLAFDLGRQSVDLW